MDYEFVNDTNPEEGVMRKIILYKEGNKVHLASSSEGIPFTLASDDEKIIFDDMSRMSSWFSDYGIFHRDISHSGDVLGGSYSLFKEGNRVYVICLSSDFGPVHKETLERCLPGYEMHAFDGSMCSKSLEEYLLKGNHK